MIFKKLTIKAKKVLTFICLYDKIVTPRNVVVANGYFPTQLSEFC